ncbi:nose resistant to fluoxetine protein 6-like [Argiope bruennichi]|uniref:Nose resistant to fluoxetine protein 6 like protein n=1 Tax=Argiope bruennichi TaxID=94029 RepID=A0A8T0ERT4_ARGBR|nr:nose resistant to fluoxetine protein 6-like [Argiope bruennichi]KAF8777146.1 Nose resistant to fluoxetine protein 6 like protein [Argiope bruennichi]
MDSCPSNSSENIPWQATLEGILSNLKGEFLSAIDTNALKHQPVSKKLTPEALFMLYIILIFVILTIIGSSISAIELFCKNFEKEIRSLMIDGNVKSSNTAAYTDIKKKSFEPSVCTGTKSRYMNIYNAQQVMRGGFHLAFDLILLNDVWKNCKKYFECFSIQNNCRKLLSTVSGEEHLNFLHGIKTFALYWVMLSHINMFYATILRNVTAEFQHFLEMPHTQFIVNGIFSNDVFFVLSGFLNGYMFFDYYKKRNGKIPWLSFYVSRFLRFTPLYLILLGFYATLFPYIGSGPIWPTYQTNPLCKENWIWNVLYLNNFQTHKTQCMLTTWFIACDLQLYIISPLFLLLLIRRPKMGFALIIACICGSCLISFMLTKHYNLIDGASKLSFHTHDMKTYYGRFWLYFDMVYVKPYTRIGTYLIGIALGYFVLQRKYSGVKKSSLITLCVGWTLAFICSFIAFFAIYNRDESDLERALYNGLKHLLMSCSISWIIFVCFTGQGGLINWFLSLPIFVPLSRLSYCIYFIHIMAIEKYVLSIDDLKDFSFVSSVWINWQLTLETVCASFIVSLIFERPLLNLLGLFLRESKSEKKTQ